MPSRARLLTTLSTLTAALVLTACGQSTTSAGEQASTTTSAGSTSAGSTSGSSTPSADAGAYVDYAAYSADPTAYADSKVVLFFHAPWCPNCRKSEESLTKDGVPAGITVVKVDYDSMTDLKKKHGVTYQHTFVLLDAAGNGVKKFVATTGEDIADEVA